MSEEVVKNVEIDKNAEGIETDESIETAECNRSVENILSIETADSNRSVENFESIVNVECVENAKCIENTGNDQSCENGERIENAESIENMEIVKNVENPKCIENSESNQSVENDQRNQSVENEQRNQSVENDESTQSVESAEWLEDSSSISEFNIFSNKEVDEFAEFMYLLNTSETDKSDESDENAERVESFSLEAVKLKMVLILGCPGAGKYTQCTNIAKQYGFVHLSARDLLRDEMQEIRSDYITNVECEVNIESDESTESDENIESYENDNIFEIFSPNYGYIRKLMKWNHREVDFFIDAPIEVETVVPDEIISTLFETAMKNAESDKFAMDGYPLSKDNLTDWIKQMEDKAGSFFFIHLDCPDNVCINRCLQRGIIGVDGRHNDDEQTIKKRIYTFYNYTMPVINYYKNLGIAITLDGSKPKEEVFSDIKEIFNEIREKL